MLNIIVGAGLGMLSGLGVGGGSLLLLWLTMVAGLPHEEARVMNLMFFLPCALAATLFRWKTARPDLKIMGFAVIAALAGAVWGNVLGPGLDREILKKAFGAMFVISGVRELRWRPKV